MVMSNQSRIARLSREVYENIKRGSGMERKQLLESIDATSDELDTALTSLVSASLIRYTSSGWISSN